MLYEDGNSYATWVAFHKHLKTCSGPGIKFLWLRHWTQVELQACSDCVNVNTYICSHNPGGIVRWEIKATPNKIYVPQNVFTATKCNHFELSFHGNHYNSVVPTEGVVPPPVIIVLVIY